MIIIGEGHLAKISLNKGLLSSSSYFYVAEQTVKNACVCIQYMVIISDGDSEIVARVKGNLSFQKSF